jgi:hypothetical protein
MQATNTIAALLYQMRQTKTPIALQRLTTVPAEKMFGVTRLHVKTHQTMCGIIKMIEIDQGLKIIYSQQYVTGRRLVYGETIDPCAEHLALRCDPLYLTKCLLKHIRFPTPLYFSQWSEEGGERDLVEYLISDALLSFARTNLSAMSEKRHTSPCQELQGITPSSRKVMLFAKSEGKTVLKRTSSDPVGRDLAKLLAKK